MPTEEQARAALAANPLPPNPWVEVTATEIRIKAGYTDTLERLLRWIAHAHWRADLRCWSVPFSGAELVRAVLPEISRLAEATHEWDAAQPAAEAATPSGGGSQLRTPHADGGGARDLFRDAARLMFGTDWLRDTARALGRDEAALACWLAGEAVVEAADAVLLGELLDLMRRRVLDISRAAERLEAALGERSD